MEISIQLLRRNREIAEVRDGLRQLTQQLQEAQTRNAFLLEEASERDGDMTRDVVRIATAEQRMPEIEAETEASKVELATQQSSRGTKAIFWRAKILNHQEELNVKKSAKRSADSQVVEAKNELSDVCRTHEAEKDALKVSQSAIAALSVEEESMIAAAEKNVEKRVESVVKEIEEHKAELATQEHDTALEASLHEERESRETLGHQLRTAVTQQVGDPMRLESLRMAITKSTSITSQYNIPDEFIGESLAELKNALRTSEDQSKSLRGQLERARAHMTDTATEKQMSLDNLRCELQTTLQESAGQRQARLVCLEDETQAEQEMASDEALSEQFLADQVRELRQRQTFSVAADTDSAECRRLAEMYYHVMAEIQTAEERHHVAEKQIMTVLVKQQDLEAASHASCIKTRGMIDTLRHNIKQVYNKPPRRNFYSNSKN